MTRLALRLFLALLRALPLRLVASIGRTLGAAAHLLAAPYRRLARRNLGIAFPQKSAGEIAALAREHFRRLGANLLSGARFPMMSDDEVRDVVRLDGQEAFEAVMAEGRGAVCVVCHLGNWEAMPRLITMLKRFRFGTIYQPLRDKPSEELMRGLRSRTGLSLFARNDGFHAPLAFVRAGGGLGVLVDQHAGDGGVWTPFFGRLASTSTLAALIASRTGAPLLPVSVTTEGPGRWRMTFCPPVPREPGESVEALSARVNVAVESMIRPSPADWFWVHNRWKTPKPHFLLAGYKRGVTLPDEMSADALQPFKILIRSPNWLGDAVMAAPAVRSIAAGRPDAQVTILSPGKLADFWRTLPEVREVIAIEEAKSGVFAVASQIRRAGPFEVAILLPNSLRSALEIWLARVPRRVGFSGHSRRRLLNQVVAEPEIVPGPIRPHHTGRYLQLARAVGGMTPDDTMAEPTSLRKPFARIGICPGAEYGPTKRWFPERFAAAAKQISASRPSRFVLFGVAKDAALGAEIEKSLEGSECENKIGETSLAGLIDDLRQCDLLITNDTGTMHLADHLGVPLVAIFGSTDDQATGPRSKRARVIRHQVECSPCFRRECPLDLRCLKAVTADEVAKAALEMLP